MQIKIVFYHLDKPNKKIEFAKNRNPLKLLIFSNKKLWELAYQAISPSDIVSNPIVTKVTSLLVMINSVSVI